jgi:hypothetical protein
VTRAISLFIAVVAFAPAAIANPSDAKLLTDVVTVELDKLGKFDVLSNADVQQALSLEAEKQAVGCSAQDCLAEIAGAMGARLVVFGQLGRLEEQYLLTLNLFDSERAASAGRELLDAEDLTGLRGQLPAAVASLVANASLPEPVEGAGQPRVLVLDIAWTAEAAPEPSEKPAAASASLPWLAIGGGVTAGVGVVGFGLGAILGYLASEEHDFARDRETTQVDAKNAADLRDVYAISSTAAWTVGGGLLVVGASVAAAQLFVGGE